MSCQKLSPPELRAHLAALAPFIIFNDISEEPANIKALRMNVTPSTASPTKVYQPSSLISTSVPSQVSLTALPQFLKVVSETFLMTLLKMTLVNVSATEVQVLTSPVYLVLPSMFSMI